ncbi:hypothetical protein ABPS01_01545 [Streptococcus sp. ZJ151]|uniref:hypothetical protein n=1 Tax=Streptococcus jiangjianxini TaxID=3161189 RepID=UPI0032EF3061
MKMLMKRLLEALATLLVLAFAGWTIYSTYPKKAVLSLANNKMTYNGVLRNGRLDGKGTLTYDNKDRYVGQFKDGAFDGQGTFYSHEGWSYTGEFKKGQANGHGRLKLPDGKQYQGKFKQGIYQK